METIKTPTAEEGYALTKNLIFDQVHKFCRRFGGDVDDLVGEAHVAFMVGHRAYVEGRGNSEIYSIEIRRCVWYKLFDKMRVRLERKRRVKFTSTNDQEDAFAEPAKSAFNTTEFMGTLTPDARITTALVLDPPPEVVRVAEAKGGTPRNYKSTVRTHLQAAGWDTDRINAAFEEIAEAL